MEKRNLFCVGILLLSSTMLLTYYDWGKSHVNTQGMSQQSFSSNMESSKTINIEAKSDERLETEEVQTNRNDNSEIQNIENESEQQTEAVTMASIRGRVNTNALNVRNAPKKNAPVLWILEEQEQVEVIEDNQDGWYQIRVGEQTGYVYAEYITLE